MGLNLFDGSDSDSDNDDSKIVIDEDFARRYEHNKKREDLQRYEELKKRGQIHDSDDSSSEDDDDDAVVSAHSKKDLKFFEALIKVRKQDPSLKGTDVKLFDSESESDDENVDGEKEKKKKAMYLKDVTAKHLIEDGPDFDDEEDEKVGGGNKLVYDAEQAEIRDAFLKAVEGEDDEELLTVKSKTDVDESEDEDEDELKKKVDEYFGETDENSKFLKEYFANKMWIDKREEDENDGPGSDDDDEVEEAEEFEFRYQEGAGDRVMGHSREVIGTVRKRASARREQRRHKEEREKAARAAREEELRHLKNLKRKEMDERVRRIMEIAGIKDEDVVPLSAKELEDEFDPEEYDRMMKKAFGDEYYAKAGNDDKDEDEEDEDEDEEGKPNFDAEDEEFGLPKGWDGREGEVTEEKEQKKKESAILKKAEKAMMEEYYKLDYEDTIGDLKTRFSYASTKGKRYGLSTAAILMMEDKELNQYVPMNKIAPYKDKEWKVPEGKRYEMKMKMNELLRHGRQSGGVEKSSSRKRGFVSDKLPSSSGVEEAGGEPSGLSSTAKRRKNRADLKLSHSRLAAYRKIETPKRKKTSRR